MKLYWLPTLLVASAFVLASSAQADSNKGRNNSRSQRFDTPVSNDSDRNRNVRNERTADYKRAQERRGDNRRYYGSHRGHGYYGYPYSGGYYGYSSYYGYPRTSIGIGLGTTYYDRDYSGTVYRDDDRPIYRGKQLSESGNSSLEVAVQRKLARLGYYKGSLDGDIGPASRRAITRYQRDNDLAETGRIDRSLVSSLDLS